MRTTHRPRPTWSLLAIGVLLLTLGTTGGAVGAALVTGADIKNGTVTTKDVKDKTLKNADLSTRTVGALTGPRGPAGPPGATGAPGQNGYQHVSGPGVDLGPGASTVLVVQCPTGSTALGGTHTSVPLGGNLIAGGPGDFDAWQLNVVNVTDDPVTVTGHAVCTRP